MYDLFPTFWVSNHWLVSDIYPLGHNLSISYFFTQTPRQQKKEGFMQINSVQPHITAQFFRFQIQNLHTFLTMALISLHHE